MVKDAVIGLLALLMFANDLVLMHENEEDQRIRIECFT